MRALIIGNGTSRAGVDLEPFGETHETFGCNAIYRDYSPGWIVCVDAHMYEELLQSNFYDLLIVYDDTNEVEHMAGRSHKKNAGTFAMETAIQKAHGTLDCIGMDFLVHDQDVNVGNVYDGTPNYTEETRAAGEDTIRRASYMRWFALQNPNVQFNFYFPQSFFLAKTFRDPKTHNVSIRPLRHLTGFPE